MLSNWTKATTTTTGTGTITLSSVSGRPLPSTIHVTGEFVQYAIDTSDGKFEAGIGKIAASNTLERTRVCSTYDGSTYNGTSATALTLASGTHTVLITPLAENLFEAMTFPFVGPSSVNYCSTTASNVNAGDTTNALIANRPCAFPFRLEIAGVLTALSCYVNTAGASSTLLLGLYSVGSNGRPEKRLAKTSSTIDTSTTGFKSQAVDTNIRITPGWYWVVALQTAGTTPKLRGSDSCTTALGMTSYSVSLGMYSNTSTSTLDDPYPTTSLVYFDTSSLSKPPAIGMILT